MSGRCSPTEALNLLRREYSPTDAAKRLTDAIHKKPSMLFCEGVAVKPHFAPRLMFVATFDDKEWRWTADIVSAVGEAWDRPAYRWEFDVDEVAALLPVRPGKKGANWEIHATLELERLGRKAALDLHNSGQLRSHLESVLKREIDFVPKDDKALASVITAFLRGAN